MSNPLRKLASDTALYGISTILGRTLNYFLVPLHTSLMYGFGPGDFGILSELYIYVAFFTVIFTYGMETTFFRYANKNSANWKNEYNIIQTSLFISTLLLATPLIYFSSSISKILGYPGKGYFIVWLVLILVFDTITALPFARLRQLGKARRFALIKISVIFLTISFNIFFLVFCREVYNGSFFSSLRPLVEIIYSPNIGIGYVILANLLASMLSLLFLVDIFFDFKWIFNQKMLKSMLNYGYPILIMGIAGTANTMIDRILLKYLLPVNFYTGISAIAAVGIYAACYKLSIFMSLTIQAFRYAAEPFFFNKANEQSAPLLFAKVMKYFIAVGCIIWLAVSLNVDILKYIFLRRKEYWEGLGIVPILLFANLLLGVYYNLTVWFKVTDKTYYGTYITFIGLIFTLSLNFLMIPFFGYMGSAWAALITYFIMCSLCWHWGNRYFSIPYHWFESIVHMAIAGLFIFISYYLRIEDIWISFLVKNSIVLVYIFILYRSLGIKLTPKMA